MALRVLSWNVEHFRSGGKVKAVADHIKGHDPDVFALYEVENLGVLELMRDHFANYSFHLTDGPEVQEILVGYKGSSRYQATFVQKREFKAYNPSLRPGACLTLRKDSVYLNLLFLHTDSGTDAAAFGNRSEMFDKVWSMKATIDKMAETGHLVVTGDFNTMGLYFPRPAKKNLAVAAAREIEVLGTAGSKASMTLLAKEHSLTFSNGTLESDLDHVLASNGLGVKTLGTRADGVKYQVAVSGWQQLSGALRDDFLNNVSDHCALVFDLDF